MLENTDRVIKVEFDGYEDVYNLEVEEFHNFAINGGLIVHNCDSVRYALTNYHHINLKVRNTRKPNGC